MKWRKPAVPSSSPTSVLRPSRLAQQRRRCLRTSRRFWTSLPLRRRRLRLCVSAPSPSPTRSMPKRAAYITKSLMDATAKSTHAYVVYSTAAAARLAASKLNGSVVLDRHLRADSVAHPSAVDHRRCVFVGNLGFVDDETVLNTKIDEDGKEQTDSRKRTKAPMDIEEGLWRTFGKQAGKVESVRVVRDEVTRVGKGIAYVQFYVSSPYGVSHGGIHLTDCDRMETRSRQLFFSRARNTLLICRESCVSAGAKRRTRQPGLWSARSTRAKPWHRRHVAPRVRSTRRSPRPRSRRSRAVRQSYSAGLPRPAAMTASATAAEKSGRGRGACRVVSSQAQRSQANGRSRHRRLSCLRAEEPAREAL